jgi:putative membrane protein
MWNGAWSGWFFGPIMMIFFLVVAVAVIVVVIRWLGGSGRDTIALRHTPSSKTPLDILKERFAKGEIDKEEYVERRRLLSE